MENSESFHPNKERDARYSFIDVSSFFVVEATGDSEMVVEFDPNVAAADLVDGDDHDDNDDAESSSCDASDPSCVAHEFNYNSCGNVEASDVNDVVVVDDDVDDDDDDDGDDGKEEEKDDQQELLESTGVQGNQKSCVSLDSTDEILMNEMDKNRLFWETCLAS